VAFFRGTGGKGWSSKIIQASTTSSSTQGRQNFTGKIEVLEEKNCADFSFAKREKLHRIKIFFSLFLIFFSKYAIFNSIIFHHLAQ